jgi:predicted metalloprotease with PDZ domain
MSVLSTAYDFPMRQRVLIACVLLLLALPALAAKRTSYDVDYLVAFLPAEKVAAVTISVRPGTGMANSFDFRMDPKRYTQIEGDGTIERDGDRLLWDPPAKGGELRYRYRIDKRRRGGGYDARITDHWTIVRGDHLIPSAVVRTTPGADSRARLRFDLPEGWSVDTPWKLAADGKRYVIVNPERRFDRPTGWMIAGDLGIRREQLDGMEIAVAAPRGEAMRRNEVLAMVHVSYPELQAAFGKLPSKILIVGAGDPMWRGGLSGPRSLYMHAARPLISENGTSTLMHELVHVITRIQGTHEPWIAEGIAEYYSLSLLYRSALISEARYRRGLEWMENHGRNVRTLRGVRSHGPVTARAVTLFAALDAEIRERSQGERDLDDVVQALMKIRRPTLEDLRRAAEDAIGAPSKTLQSRVLD